MYFFEDVIELFFVFGLLLWGVTVFFLDFFIGWEVFFLFFLLAFEKVLILLPQYILRLRLIFLSNGPQNIIPQIRKLLLFILIMHTDLIYGRIHIRIHSFYHSIHRKFRYFLIWSHIPILADLFLIGALSWQYLSSAVFFRRSARTAALGWFYFDRLWE